MRLLLESDGGAPGVSGSTKRRPHALEALGCGLVHWQDWVKMLPLFFSKTFLLLTVPPPGSGGEGVEKGTKK